MCCLFAAAPASAYPPGDRRFSGGGGYSGHQQPPPHSGRAGDYGAAGYAPGRASADYSAGELAGPESFWNASVGTGGQQQPQPMLSILVQREG